MSFLDKRKSQLKIKSAGEFLKQGIGRLNVPEMLVQGPDNIDCLERKWHKGDMLTLVGASSSGKTTMNLYIFKSILINNPNSFCLFIATEMNMNTILQKWKKLTKNEPEISNRLYIITAVDEDKCTVDMTMSGIISNIKKYKAALDQDLICVALDHLNNVPRDDNESLDKVTMRFNTLIIEEEFFGILNSQTTKALGGKGDKPLDKYSVYGTSKPTQDSTYMLSICQPLIRVGTDPRAFPCTAFQYCKIRFKEKDDKLKESINYLLRFDPDTEGYLDATDTDKLLFEELYPDVLELIKAEEKDSAFAFDTSRNIKTAKGNTVRLQRSTGVSTEDKWD